MARPPTERAYYFCTHCEHTWEQWLRRIVTCPQCIRTGFGRDMRMRRPIKMVAPAQPRDWNDERWGTA